jgi:hypothetical protein
MSVPLTVRRPLESTAGRNTRRSKPPPLPSGMGGAFEVCADALGEAASEARRATPPAIHAAGRIRRVIIGADGM